MYNILSFFYSSATWSTMDRVVYGNVFILVTIVLINGKIKSNDAWDLILAVPKVYIILGILKLLNIFNFETMPFNLTLLTILQLGFLYQYGQKEKTNSKLAQS